VNASEPPEQVFVTQLTPLLFLERAAEVFPDRNAVAYGDRRESYAELGSSAQQLAGALAATGIAPGDRVAYLLPNLPEMLVAHFGVPLAHAVLVTINTRLSGPEITYILQHSGSKILVADTELLATPAPDLDACPELERVIALDDTGAGLPAEATPYDEFIAAGVGAERPWRVDDEQRVISINYTSGTTGRPKGVMYTHRGAYLNALAEVVHSHHDSDSVYLWTLPMFHCNGWCTSWGVTALGGRHVCLRAVDPELIWRLFDEEGVTHFNAAPTVLVMLSSHPAASPLARPITVTTGGAPPSPTIVNRMSELGARIVHVYGLTETYGPYTVCEWQHEWADEPVEQRARLLARQGVAFVGADPIRVVDDEMRDVPRDGMTMGEVVMRGNNVMAGYFGDPVATEEAFRGGWFHSGDLAVWHPDGYIELRDRAKDIIISGGENISTIEVEQAILTHEAVLECAVVAIPHETWGERPKAFVVLRDGAVADPHDLIEHVRSRIARFKAPDEIAFLDALPKTSTGKVQKYALREQARAAHSKLVN
jgi:acyl-CoA synthetase (AMP-forming)/AMP-acid ligase II